MRNLGASALSLNDVCVVRLDKEHIAAAAARGTFEHLRLNPAASTNAMEGRDRLLANRIKGAAGEIAFSISQRTPLNFYPTHRGLPNLGDVLIHGAIPVDIKTARNGSPLRIKLADEQRMRGMGGYLVLVHEVYENEKYHLVGGCSVEDFFEIASTDRSDLREGNWNKMVHWQSLKSMKELRLEWDKREQAVIDMLQKRREERPRSVGESAP